MRTLAFVLGGVAAGGLAILLASGGTGPLAQQAASAPDSITAPVIADTGALQGPRQPVFFRHDIHAGQFKIQCQYCHYSVAVSPEPGIRLAADVARAVAEGQRTGPVRWCWLELSDRRHIDGFLRLAKHKAAWLAQRPAPHRAPRLRGRSGADEGE